MAETKDTEQFQLDLQLLWSAEKMLTEAMPRMVDKAKNFGLKKGLAHHLAETQQHKAALELICRQLGFSHTGRENADMKNIIEEGEKTMNGAAGHEAIDAAIIAAAVKVEQYEIIKYGAIAGTARKSGYMGIASRLALTLEEERQANTRLNFLWKEAIDRGIPVNPS